MIISTISLKGGSGKTTIATSVSVELSRRGYKVTLVDADPNNQNCVIWSGYRDEKLPKVHTIALPDAAALRNNIREVENNCDYVIIDGTPALSNLTGTIMLISDLNLIPLRASTWDFWAFDRKFIPKYNEVLHLKEDLDCRILLNAVTKRKKISKEVSKVIREYDMQIMESIVCNRTSFESAPMNGQDVKEYGDDLAANEIRLLTDECINILKSK